MPRPFKPRKKYTVIYRSFGSAATIRDPRPFEMSYHAIEARNKLFQSDDLIQACWIELDEGLPHRERYGQVLKRTGAPYRRGDYLKTLQES